MRIPGAHRVVRRRADKVVIDWYPWRGKGAPRAVSFTGETLEAAQKAEAASVARIATEIERARGATPATGFVDGLVVAYLESPEWERLRASTKALKRNYLTHIRADLGDVPLSELGLKGARRTVIEWRNQWRDRPRAADTAIETLCALLNWGINNELCDHNPARSIGDLWEADRSDEIWTDDELARALAIAPAHVAIAIRLATATALRLGDLISLTWSAVEAGRPRGVTEWRTEKSNGRITARIILTEALRQALADAPRVGETVLVNSRGGKWTRDGLGHAIARVASAAGVDKTAHDLRGTAVTRMIEQGLTYAEAAIAAAWTERDVERIAKRYVSKRRISELAAARLALHPGAAEGIQSGVGAEPSNHAVTTTGDDD